jgi:transketolase
MSELHQIDQRCINTIRFLSADAVQKANSGHPGSPLGDAVLAWVLWDRFLRHNPANPSWPGRDRFILSAGHASMLLYSVLHLSGYDISLDDIRNFRQWESKTAGHPEYGMAPGVEMTTGPLGQGFAHGIGMAIAERWLAQRYNRPGHTIIDNFTYAFVSDGDLQEGISYEAASLAGSLRLGKLVYLYMDNDVQIEGPTDLAFTEDVGARFRALSWQVIGPIDGMDPEAVDAAIRQARTRDDKPSLIICRTVIGYGSPLANNCESHGAPLGEENLRRTKETLGWPADEKFLVPDDVRAHARRAVDRGKADEERWLQKFEAYRAAYPAEASELQTILAGELHAGWDADLDVLTEKLSGNKATRVFNGAVLNHLAKKLPLIGGSADLGPSVKTVIEGEKSLSGLDFSGRNLHFGVREHAMAAVTNGIALYAGLLPFCSTFLIFVDYMRPAVRLAALMKLRSLFVFSHDSIGLGEDGPTHQPIEQLMNLRGVPNLQVIRPCDAAETVEVWRAAIMKSDGPTALIFTRQNVPAIDRSTHAPATGLHRGAYTLWQASDGEPDIILIGTGSELQFALQAGKTLASEGVNARVVSFPCWELFDAQDAAYRESVLPHAVRRRVAVEAGLAQGWERYTGLDGAVVGMRSFGASAPAEVLYEKFGITTEAVLSAARELLKN